MTKVSKSSIERIRELRKKKPDMDELASSIIDGDPIALSRGITIIESLNKENSINADHLVSKCLPHCVSSFRMGITGVPGVGKSTFIEAFWKFIDQA